MRVMSDCPAWKPIGDEGGIHRHCATCGSTGGDHYPEAFLQGLGLSAPSAQRVVAEVADALEPIATGRVRLGGKTTEGGK